MFPIHDVWGDGLMTSTKSVVIPVRIPIEIREALKTRCRRIAESTGLPCSMSALVRKAIREHIFQDVARSRSRGSY